MKLQLFAIPISVISLVATSLAYAQSCPNCTTGNCQSGQGTCVWEGRGTYTGDWQNGKKHGLGKESWNDGSSYDGSYVEGQFEGLGTYIGNIGGGNKYVGHWKTNKREGEGTLFKADGTQQTGCWKGPQVSPCEGNPPPKSDVLTSAPPSGKKVALVIGNKTYQERPLHNPINDATDLAAELKKLGFEVILKTDATYQEMGQAIGDFGAMLEDGGVALFYYSGHGLQYENLNYLIPLNAELNREADVKLATIGANHILDQMEQVHNGVNIIILDACRSITFGRGLSRGSKGSRGLAKMDAPTGSIIVYATQPGNTADDGKGRNGTYTAKLLAVLREKPSLKLLEFFNEVGVRVAMDTKQEQVPWLSSSPLPPQTCFAPCQN